MVLYKMYHLRKTLTLKRLISKTNNMRIRYQSGDIYEPSYLEAMKPKFPQYDAINIQLKGYDYPVLEQYQKFIHKMLNNMDINVEESWSVPPQHTNVTTLKSKSEVVHAQYNLKIYERVVQITDISAIQLPIIIRAVETSLPAGVNVQFRQHEEADEEIRYIPDAELNTLKQELKDLGGPSKTKR